MALRRSFCCVTAASALVVGLTATAASAAPESGRGRCISELARAGLIGRDVDPRRANFVVGTEGDDVFDSMVTDGVDIICGFGGNDFIEILDAGDVFLGGDGNDHVVSNRGTFIGGEGNDEVNFIEASGVFNGGAGDDAVSFTDPGTVFNGGDGNDRVAINDGTFNGGPGDDSVDVNEGTFNGGEGNDSVRFFNGGEFNQ